MEHTKISPKEAKELLVEEMYKELKTLLRYLYATDHDMAHPLELYEALESLLSRIEEEDKA